MRKQASSADQTFALRMFNKVRPEATKRVRGSQLRRANGSSTQLGSIRAQNGGDMRGGPDPDRVTVVGEAVERRPGPIGGGPVAGNDDLDGLAEELRERPDQEPDDRQHDDHQRSV